MKLKSLLLFGSIALGAGASYAAETITVDGSPLSLNYAKGDVFNDFFNGEGKSVGSSITYELNVEKAGDYILYLQTGNKLNAGQLHEYSISLNGVKATSISLDKNIGGNWNNYVIMPASISLPEGQVFLKISQTGERCYIHPTNAPYLVPAGMELALGEDEVSIDVMHPDPSSSLTFTTYAGYGVDNSGFGDDNSVLVTGDDQSANNGTKMQACYPKTKLYYLVNVAAEGEYPVSLKGFFYSTGASSDIIPDFPVHVKAYWNGNYFSEDVVTGFSMLDTKYAKAEGTLNLKKGVYMLEVSTPHLDQFLLADMTIGVPEEGNIEGVPVGKYVPVVSFEEPAAAYFGHAFSICGSVVLDQEDDVIDTAELYLGEKKLGTLDIEEGNTFTFDVEDTDLFPETGEYTFIATVTTKRGYTSSADVTIDLQKQMFTIDAIAGAGGSISFEDGEKVAEGDDITVTVTPDEGYVIDSILVDNEPVEFTVNEDGTATYTFENVTSDMMIEATFAKMVFNITASVNGEGGKIEVVESVEYGDSVVITVTPNEGYEVNSVEVNGESVTFTADNNGVVKYTVENVTGDITVAATFIEKEDEESSFVENVKSDSISIKNVNGDVLINVAEESAVALYDLCGNVIFSGYVSESKVIESNVKGIVILSVDGNTYKVVL